MSISADNKSIKIPAKHYVGFQKRADDDVPLGFMTPDGDDAAAQKRKDTVDTWAKGGHYRQNKVDLPAQSFENKPLSGFRLGKNVRHGHGWGQGSVKWRIEDPRGFELEISSPNLAQILAISTVENGEILDKCAWGRLGNENILLPVSSDVYKTATANTERMGKKASLRDLKPGDTVVLQNGTEGVYYGSLYPIRRGYDGNIGQEDKKRHIILSNVSSGGKEVHLSASLKIAEITQGERKGLEDYALELNGILATGIERNGYQPLIAVSSSAIQNVKCDLKAVTVAEIKAMDNPPDRIVAKKDGKYAVAYSYNLTGINNHSTSQEGYLIEIANYYDNKGFDYFYDTVTSRWGSWHRNNIRMTVDANDSTVEWFIPVAEFDTSAGKVTA